MQFYTAAPSNSYNSSQKGREKKECRGEYLRNARNWEADFWLAGGLVPLHCQHAFLILPCCYRA